MLRHSLFTGDRTGYYGEFGGAFYEVTSICV